MFSVTVLLHIFAFYPADFLVCKVTLGVVKSTKYILYSPQYQNMVINLLSATQIMLTKSPCKWMASSALFTTSHMIS